MGERKVGRSSCESCKESITQSIHGQVIERFNADYFLNIHFCSLNCRKKDQKILFCI